MVALENTTFKVIHNTILLNYYLFRAVLVTRSWFRLSFTTIGIFDCCLAVRALYLASFKRRRNLVSTNLRNTAVTPYSPRALMTRPQKQWQASQPLVTAYLHRVLLVGTTARKAQYSSTLDRHKKRCRSSTRRTTNFT